MDLDFITHQPMLVGAIALVIVLLFIVEWLIQTQEAAPLTPTQLVDSLNHDRAKVIDLRHKEVFKKGHILGSAACDPDELQKSNVLIQGNGDPFIVLVCQQGLESRKLANKLKGSGFHVRYLKGGIEAWRAEALPLIKK